MENENKIFLGKYRVVAEQSPTPPEVGGSSFVYKAVEIDSGREVLVEMIPASSLKTSVREQLEAEALASKKISHVNIPALYDFGVADDQLVYVTEFVDGTTAEAWVASHGPMPAAAVLRIALQVVAALGAAAFHKIEHHALNPGNLLLAPGQTADGEWPLVKVLHFVGIAPAFGTSDIATARFDSSANFASPEQLRGSKVDFRSEIYSLGCTMWFLLTGASPLIAPGGPVSVQSTDSGLAVDKLTGIPKGLRRLLAQMLSVNPEARPHDPLALYKELEELLSRVEQRTAITRKFGIPISSRPQVFAFSSHRRISAKAIALAAVLLTLATLAALVGPARLRSWQAHRAASPSEIGVPIGVPDASVAPAPGNAPIDNSRNVVARNQPIEATASEIGRASCRERV